MIDLKGSLHLWLDRIQSLTPGFLRAAIRPLYLNLFYRHVYPDYLRAPVIELEPAENGRIAWSDYAPFLVFKKRVCRSLSMDLSGFGCDCQKGLVSVVLPVYNGAQFLAASIDSVRNQTYRNLELIVVDDGSTDESPAIVQRYASLDRRVHVIRQENRKLPAALNTGFAKAVGEYFTWTSADNLMKPEMLAELVQFLAANSDAEMVYADEELIEDSGLPALHTDFCRIYQTPPGSHELLRPRDPGELNFIQNNYIGGCFLYRSWAARIVGGYSENCFGFEDYDYWLRMNALFRIVHLGKRVILYSYRLHNDSLTAHGKELQIADRTRYFLPSEEERRRFFAGSFDITLVGEHPWYRTLAKAYRESGHNVFELRRMTEESLYHHRVTRAFPKSVRIGDDFWLADNRLTTPAGTYTAATPDALAYPLLAIANSLLQRGAGASFMSPNDSGT